MTRFTYRLHEVGPMITGGLVAWGAERAEEILAAYKEITAAAPRELTLATVVRMAPTAPFVPEEWHGKPIVAIVACYSGDDPDRVAPIRDLPEPVVRVRDSWEAIRRYSTGGNYVDFQLADDDGERLQSAYGGNCARHREVKAEYDPDNFFRVNRNIPPAV